MERLYYKEGDSIDEKTLRHLKRYNFIKNYILRKHEDLLTKDCIILDFGTGSGYGAKHLTKQIKKPLIIGYDISEEAINYAIQHNQEKNIIFTTEKPKSKADIVLMVDVIEHVENPEELIKEVIGLSKPQSLFFISTPLSLYSGQSVTNKYHKHLFTREEFEELIDKYFVDKELWLLDFDFHRKINSFDKEGFVMCVCRLK